VLCLEDRTPLGRVTEVFGPVQAPLYALRYSGSSGAPPDSVAAGTHVCAVARYASALEPEIVQQQVSWPPAQPLRASVLHHRLLHLQNRLLCVPSEQTSPIAAQAPIIEDEIEQDDPSFQFSDDEQVCSQHECTNQYLWERLIKVWPYDCWRAGG
jgi:hypothetical protein